MLFLRSLPLSLSVFWRFLLVMPLWLILYIPIGILGALVMVVASLVPVLGILVAIALILALNGMMAIHPMLLAIRLGLQVRGIKGEKSNKKLLVAAMGYGGLEAFFALVVFGVGGALLIFSASGKEFVDVFVGGPDGVGQFEQLFADGPAALFVLAVLLLLGLFRVALLPVLAGAAAGRDPERYHHTPMNGFGKRFPGVMFALIMSVILMGLLYYLMITAFAKYGIYSGGPGFPFSESDIAAPGGAGDLYSGLFTMVLPVFLGNLLIVAWVICLQAATAALTFEDRLGNMGDRKAMPGPDRAKREKPGVAAGKQTVDIAELRRSRMQKL